MKVQLSDPATSSTKVTLERTKDARGNILGERSSAIAIAGKSVKMIDVYFKVQ